MCNNNAYKNGITITITIFVNLLYEWTTFLFMYIVDKYVPYPINIRLVTNIPIRPIFESMGLAEL